MRRINAAKVVSIWGISGMRSLNVRFAGELPPDSEFPTPPGLAVLRFLRPRLNDADWQTTEPENWRDSGWFVTCSKENVEVDVVAIQVYLLIEQEWFLQICPTNRPGIIRQWLGATASANATDVYGFSTVIHEILRSDSRFTEIRWRVDGDPNSKYSTMEPTI